MTRSRHFKERLAALFEKLEHCDDAGFYDPFLEQQLFGTVLRPTNNGERYYGETEEDAFDFTSQLLRHLKTEVGRKATAFRRAFDTRRRCKDCGYSMKSDRPDSLDHLELYTGKVSQSSLESLISNALRSEGNDCPKCKDSNLTIMEEIKEPPQCLIARVNRCNDRLNKLHFSDDSINFQRYLSKEAKDRLDRRSSEYEVHSVIHYKWSSGTR